MALPAHPLTSGAGGVVNRPVWDKLTLFTGNVVSEEPSSEPYSNYGFIDTIALLQRLGVEFLPVTYQAALGLLGGGGQADVYQAIVNVQTSFAFKLYEATRREHACDFQRLINEVIMLTHPLIKNHPCIVKLEGFGWEIQEDNNVSPVLVFEKAHMGDLNHFITSGIWLDIPVTDRLSICADIGIAIKDMHSNGIVHGDLKPGNVLVFKDETGKYVGKVADFGYSTRFRDADDLVAIPSKSIPWDAPEYHHRPIALSKAKKRDVYSFGALCLWLVFERLGSRSSSSTSNTTNEQQQSLENLIVAHKSGDGLLNLAVHLVAEEESLNGDIRTQLVNFFKASLAEDPENRIEDTSKLILLLDPERMILPIDPIQLDPIPQVENFQISSCIYQLYEADFRLRSFVVKELQSLLSDHARKQQHISLENVALQLAFCYQLGCGVERDINIAKKYLNDYNILETDLNDQLELIKETVGAVYKESLFNSLNLRGHVIPPSQTDYYRKINQLDTAVDVSLREIADLHAALGTMHPLAIIKTSQVACILKEMDHLQEAEDLDLQNLRRLGINWDPDNELVALGFSSMINLAAIYKIRANWKESEELYSKMLSWLKQGRYSDHPIVLTISSNLAATYRNQGRLEEAEYLALEVVEKRKALFGIDHIETLASMSSLSNTLDKSGKWKEAEKQEQEVVARLKKTLGQDHPMTTTCMANLAVTYQSHGRYHEAIELMSEVMLNAQKTIGRDHPITLGYIAQVASLMRTIGHVEHAQRFLTHVVTARQRVLGPDHPSLLTSMSNLASLHQLQGNLDEAEKLELQVIEKSTRILGENHTDTLQSQGNLAAIYRKQKRLQEAEVLERRVLDLTVQRFGDQNPDSLQSMSNLGHILFDLGQYKQAEELFAHVVKYRRQLLGPENLSTLTATGNLSMTYQMQGKLETAAELEFQVWKIRTQVLGENHQDTLTSVNNMAAILKGQGHRDEAVELMTECVRRQKQKLGADHALTKISQGMLDDWHAEIRT